MSSPLRSKHTAGIWFWLNWILTAAASFLVSFLFWNWLLVAKLGADLKTPGHAIAWIVAIFGTWLVILIPLMARKEKVMGHMDRQDESTVSWWLVWIALAIGSFFLAVWFWTPFIRDRFGSVKNPGVSLVWIVAVFGTWLVALIPLMVFMYCKVDQAYEEARIRREMRAEKFKDPVKIKAVFVEESRRRLSKALVEKLKRAPQTIKEGHLITAILKDGRKVENVFIASGKELLGIYDQEELTFEAEDITDFELTDLTHPPEFTQKTWLRLDGNGVT